MPPTYLCFSHLISAWPLSTQLIWRGRMGVGLDNEWWAKRSGFASWLIIHSWLPNACNRHFLWAFWFSGKALFFSLSLPPSLSISPTPSPSVSFFLKRVNGNAYLWISAVEESVWAVDGTQLSTSGPWKVLAIQTRRLVGIGPWLPWSSWQSLAAILQVRPPSPTNIPTWTGLACFWKGPLCMGSMDKAPA